MSQFGNYIYHPQDPAEQAPISTKFDGMSADQLTAIVNRSARSNQERTNDAITTADFSSFLIANPQVKRSDKNAQVIDHQLSSMGITHPIYEDFCAAYDALTDSGLLTIDDKAEAPKTFTGPLSKQTFDSVDSLVLNERNAAIRSNTRTQEEIDLDKLPSEQVLPLMKQLGRNEELKVVGAKNQRAGDAFVLVTPEYKDTVRNGKMMCQQLKNNGVLESAASVADYKTAFDQLRPSGLLEVNQEAVNKQHQDTLRQEAAEALAPEPSEEEMYALPMAELEKRARGW